MIHKLIRAGTMPNIKKWFVFFAVSAMALSSCQPAETVNAGSPKVVREIPLLLQLVVGKAEEEAPNECLKCHSDKDRLIETADPVEPVAESESKGVG